jgi:hypothetical protein
MTARTKQRTRIDNKIVVDSKKFEVRNCFLNQKRQSHGSHNIILLLFLALSSLICSMNSPRTYNNVLKSLDAA